MAATKAGIRESRASQAEFIDADAPIAVTGYGQTVGYFIPTRGNRAAEIAKLKTVGEKVDALLKLEGSDVDEMAEAFRQVRRKVRR